MNIETLERAHFDKLLPNIQQRQYAFADSIQYDPNFFTLIKKAGPSVAFVSGDEVLGAAGLIDFEGTGRAVVWLVFAESLKDCFVGVFRGLVRLMRFYPRRRYEAHIDPAWPEAQRLIKALGFSCEGLMRAFEADGSDRELWALVR